MEHFDVIIIGAGLSGIGAARHLQDRCPDRTFVLLEGRHAIGGTWDLFRYPGIRSDSDMHTLGYDFKPWEEAKAIADGPAIRRYVQETASETGIETHIRFGHRVTAASWDSVAARWTVSATTTATPSRAADPADPAASDAQPTASGQVEFTCSLLYFCSGYYRTDKGYTPDFVGRSEFAGRLVHPQSWPEDLDCSGKHVIVIGSGATAVTLVPALVERGARVTMVQRSPTYVVARPARDAIANGLRRVLPARWAYAATRFKNVQLQRFFYRQSRTAPGAIRRRLLAGVRQALGPDYDVDTHFTPSYNPWDQRLCLVPDGDLFAVLRNGQAEVVTDAIERFTPAGLRLGSGRELAADVIVTATGLELEVLGGVAVTVDGAPVDFARTWTYHGMMCSDVPNLVQAFGYINASWTLRADLTSAWVCRLLNHLRATGTRQFTPRLRDSDQDMVARPWIEGFTPGYMQRAMHRFPQQGDRSPWQNTQDYVADRRLLLRAPIADGVLVFDNPAAAPTPAAASAAARAA